MTTARSATRHVVNNEWRKKAATQCLSYICVYDLLSLINNTAWRWVLYYFSVFCWSRRRRKKSVRLKHCTEQNCKRSNRSEPRIKISQEITNNNKNLSRKNTIRRRFMRALSRERKRSSGVQKTPKRMELLYICKRNLTYCVTLNNAKSTQRCQKPWTNQRAKWESSGWREKKKKKKKQYLHTARNCQQRFIHISTSLKRKQ